MTDRYVEYPPPARLRAHVECFWSRTRSPHAPDVTRVLPDGCVDIVLGFNGALSFAQAVGTMTRPLVVRGSEHASVVGVRFRPGCARMVFGLPASELTDLRVPLDEVWPDEATFASLRWARPSASRGSTLHANSPSTLGSHPRCSPASFGFGAC